MDKVYKYNDISIEKLDEILKDLTESIVPTEREFRLWTGCKSRGLIEMMGDGPCGDSTCSSCHSFSNGLFKRLKDE